MADISDRLTAALRENKQLRSSLKRCLTEAEDWLDEARGCKPDEMMDYDGWADEAKKILRIKRKHRNNL
jgi:hypothetical protein